ncbi:phage tail tape measure protein [Paenibacillus antibioticophila]|uniref:hypothetical protein n=1 Tax=Paenibacillus antibioticophila TaxID=1274374 RepID=UPI0006781197|nr:hypothetical protein [Paenibacillus antibioticophila]
MANKRELEALIVLAGKIDPSLRKALLETQKRTEGLSKQTGLIGKVAQKSFGIMKNAAAGGMVALGVGMAYAGKVGLDLASDLTEVQNVVDVTFGKGAEQINEFAQSTLKAFGLSELSAKQYSGTLGALMKASGVSSDHLITMSENLTALAGDFASFHNLDPAESFEKIKSGISGETEPLKALGINMSVANMEAFALSKGIKTAYSKMDQASQTMLRYNYLMEMSKDAQGDFARTQDSYANQQKLFGESFKQLAGNIMSAALPAFTKLYEKGNQLIDSFAGSPEKVERLQNVIAKAADTVINALPKIIDGAKRVLNVAGKIYSFISGNWSVIEPMIVGIVAAMVAWKAITLGMSAYQGIMAAIKGATIATTVAQWGLNTAVLANPMTWIVLGIAAAIGVVVAAVYLLWKHWDTVSAWIVGLWQNNILPFFLSIGDWFSNIWTGMVNGFMAAWSGVSSWFSNLWEGILGVFKGYINLWIKPINMLIDSLNSLNIKVPDWVPGMGGKEFGVSIPNIPTFARGGFANQPSIFGEAGPEAAIPLKRTPRSLSLLSKTAKILGVDGDGDGKPTFVFAPVLGGGDSSGVLNKLEEAADDFFERCDRWWESKRRESYAG